ncbi:MAG: RHS repeat protein, partial [Planctomycetes bacterium]|nr:RHS repeat protein [Planctomycetota bacterium]
RYGDSVEARQPTNLVRSLYDERDLLFQEIQAEGDPDQSTTQYDYDGNENLVVRRVGLENTPRVHTYIFDGYDRRVETIDPMGNRTTYHYDANSNRAASRTGGQLDDVAGDANNVRLTEMTYVYDEMDRLVREEYEFFDTETQASIDDGKAITITEYSDNSQMTRGVNDNNHDTRTTYDTANRRNVVTDAKNNTTTYAYDANSNVVAMTEVEKSDLGGPEEVFSTTHAYDGLDRMIAMTDNVGNTNNSLYDSRNNRTRMIDAKGNVVRYVYDGINRLTETIRKLRDTGDGTGQLVGTITTRQSWDDTSRLTGQSDDNGNTTTYEYDALDRMTAERYADERHLHKRLYCRLGLVLRSPSILAESSAQRNCACQQQTEPKSGHFHYSAPQ